MGLYFSADIAKFFLNGSSICQTGAWQLVWHDEFNGIVVDNTKWYTFYADWQCGCDTSLYSRTHGDVAGAPNSTIYEDNNIIVSNGTAKVKLENETATWKGVTTNFTGGVLLSKINFQYGRFEARIKIPNG